MTPASSGRRLASSSSSIWRALAPAPCLLRCRRRQQAGSPVPAADPRVPTSLAASVSSSVRGELEQALKKRTPP
ncbi:hypothetical protein DAI22_02g151250 [Oryza sativa Japonica Group]|nr:hypothetical protein DAI22_02g151250 [Oryza sativa Japonica Group]